MKPILKYNNDRRVRVGTHASDYGKLGIDMILDLKKTEPTNPAEWNNCLRMGAGKGAELEMVKILKQNGVLAESFDQDNAPVLALTTKDGVPIAGHIDGIVKEGGATIKVSDMTLPETKDLVMNEGEPIEIKTINNKNSFDIQKYINDEPRESYVGQLSRYMQMLGKDTGYLFVTSIDGLYPFWFVCKKIEEGIYQCGKTVVDLNKEDARLAKIWAAKDKTLEELTEFWNEEIYKIPIKDIDWTKLSVSKIGDIRNGRYVVGSEDKWKIDYSEFKDLILKAQGVEPGYSNEELEEIRNITAGFSSKKKTNA